jgi:hypothetical protein
MSDARKDVAALRRMLDALDEDVLEEEYPLELIEEEIRAAGGDPEAIGRRGAALAKELLDKRRRAFEAEALESVAELEKRAVLARARPVRSREHMLRRVRRAEADPRFAGQVAVAFRGRKPEEPTDEELATLVAKLEALGVLPPDDDDA